MSEEDKKFVPDPNKTLFTIKIEVCENCQWMQVLNQGEYKAKFQEIIGALETQKNSMWLSQQVDNLEAWIKQKKELNQLPEK